MGDRLRDAYRFFAEIRLRNQRELWLYVACTTALCVCAALSIDIANQLIFFESWSAAIRSWAITVVVVLVLAIPVSRAIGKAHLALYLSSRTDALTGLLNRSALLECVAEVPSFIALIIVDVDRFKLVNDTHGHLVGDEVLQAVARVMSVSLEHRGPIGRLGGEEFAILASDGDAAALLADLERFRDRVASTPVIAGSAAVSVTISAGLAHRGEGHTFEQLYARADRALYVAKAAGRNRIVLADDLDPHLLGERSRSPAASDFDPRQERRSAG